MTVETESLTRPPFPTIRSLKNSRGRLNLPVITKVIPLNNIPLFISSEHKPTPIAVKRSSIFLFTGSEKYFKTLLAIFSPISGISIKSSYRAFISRSRLPNSRARIRATDSPTYLIPRAYKNTDNFLPTDCLIPFMRLSTDFSLRACILNVYNRFTKVRFLCRNSCREAALAPFIPSTLANSSREATAISCK